MKTIFKTGAITLFSAFALSACGGDDTTPIPAPVTPPGGGGSSGGGTGNPVILADLVYGQGASDSGNIDLISTFINLLTFAMPIARRFSLSMAAALQVGAGLAAIIMLEQTRPTPKISIMFPLVTGSFATTQF